LNYYEQFVQKLANTCESPVAIDLENAAELASEYQELCAMANSRLLDVDRLLTKGLRSEAVEYSKTQPDLLDLFRVLDFHLRPRWNELCERNKLPIAPFLSEQTARQLNTAYSVEAQLEPFLKNHRRLALMKAPIRERIVVLRQLLLQDPSNLGWIADVEEMELARLQEIKTDLNDSYFCSDFSQVAAVWQELNDGGWRVAVPLEIQQTANIRQEALKGSAATQSVLGKVPELKRSIQNGDYKLAFAIIEKCDEIIRTITETSNLQETLHEYLALRQQVINHLEDQKQTREFNAAVSLFEKYMAVKDPGDDDWVELKHNLNLRFKTLQSFGREIPAQVQHDYNKMIRECDRLQDRMLNSRRLAVLVGIIGVVVIAGLVIVGLLF